VLKQLFTKKKKVVHAAQAELPPAPDPYYKLVVGSTTWGFINQWAKRELAKARLNNDSLGLDEVATAALRGRIDAFKDLLTLPKEGEKKGLLTVSASLDTYSGWSEYGE